MKRSIEVIFMSVAIGLLSITAATAEGIQEQRENFGDDLVTITGTVEFTASGTVLKTSGGQEYELMYPRFAAEEINVESGDTISVEGYIVPGPRWEEDDDEQHLMISKVTIDGEEYDLSRQFGPGSRGGVFGGRMCCDDGEYGYGPRGGYGMSGRPGGPGPYDRNGYDRGPGADPRGPGMQGSRSYRW